MEDERSRLLSRISQLAGQINRHKNEQAGGSLRGAAHQSGYAASSNGYHPYQRTRGSRGGYHGRSHNGGYPGRSLAVNSSVPSTNEMATSATTSTPETPSFVTRSDRHLQLINTNVYGQDTSSYSRALQLSKQKHLRDKNSREKAKLRSFLRSKAISPVNTDDTDRKQYAIDIGGIKYHVANGGSKLIKVDKLNMDGPTPKMVTVGGVKFFRSKHGNLYRESIVKAQRHHSQVTKSSEPCKAFSFSGSCPKGPQCRYIHDYSKVAICKEFLQKGTCPSGDHCDLSHDPKPERTPTCLHYSKGNCSNPECRYAHSTASLGAMVCQSFGLYGYCDKGIECPQRHVYECPDFSNTGKCNTKGCKLLHRERASVLRKQQQREANGDYTDISSDEESVDSGDFDSEVEELFHNDDDSDFDLNQDMVAL